MDKKLINMLSALSICCILLLSLFGCLVLWSCAYEPAVAETIENVNDIEDPDGLEDKKFKVVKKIDKFVKNHLDYLSDKDLISITQMKYNISHATNMETYKTWKASYNELANPIIQQKKDDEEQARLEEEARLAAEAAVYYAPSYPSGGDGVLTAAGGVNYYNGVKETWYSQRVLPGGGLNIPGRHVAADGTIRDADGYIVVAATDKSKGTVVDTSLGAGKVYDTGGMGPNHLDIYTDW